MSVAKSKVMRSMVYSSWRNEYIVRWSNAEGCGSFQDPKVIGDDEGGIEAKVQQEVLEGVKY